jgi:coenzyme Q-binding protein COQ10
VPSFKTVRRVSFTPRQMFDLVADVESYPLFLPLCESLVVTRREEAPAVSVIVAKMGVGYKAIRENFTTRVTLQPDAPSILVEYLDGPFRHLENRWRFLQAPGGSDIDFFITYDFKSAMLGLLVGAMFDRAFRHFAEAFEQRAQKVYGSAPVRTSSA